MTPISRKRRRAVVVIPAGGKGTRMGGRVPKQFLRIGGASILERTIAAFQRHPAVVEIVVVSPPAYRDRIRRMIKRRHFGKVSAVVIGGRVRQESVWKGLQAILSDATIVLIHDAVRPFVTQDLIDRVITATTLQGAAVPALLARETLLHQGPEAMIDGVLDRSACWFAQTPQGFRRDLILAAFRSALKAGFVGTDDSSLMLRTKYRIRIVPGSEENIKITTPHDLRHARRRVPRRPFHE